MAGPVRNHGAPLLAQLDAALARGEIDESTWHCRMAAVITPAYLSADSPRSQSGHSGDSKRWITARGAIAEAVHHDGSFLDVGCANGHLLECLVDWAQDRGLTLDPYGVDIAPELIELAQRRLPHWRDRFFAGNALSWRPPQQYDFVRTGLEYVPFVRRGDLIRRLTGWVRPGGRLIIGVTNETVEDRETEALLSQLGIAVGGIIERKHRDARLRYRLVWVDIA